MLGPRSRRRPARGERVRIHIVTIFPEIFDALHASLIGRANTEGILEISVHDLRDWTEDRHRTVDDTPYGGGPGMVMKPEPWGRALDTLLEGAGVPDPLVIFTTPAGEVFRQRTAHALAHEAEIIICCGRYEGIDQRVVEYASSRTRVSCLSIGDYVLNGGETAALAIVEAVGRLVPGVVGNPDSLTEESHEGGLLEYPSYTKPASWRGWDVPPVLLSGNHGAIDQWRRSQRLERTRLIRPDLLDESDGPEHAPGWTE